MKPRKVERSRGTNGTCSRGHEPGYSGWTQLDDGRIFVIHYTDDISAASTLNSHNFGVPWIRATFLETGNLPVRKELK